MTRAGLVNTEGVVVTDRVVFAKGEVVTKRVVMTERWSLQKGRS